MQLSILGTTYLVITDVPESDLDGAGETDFSTKTIRIKHFEPGHDEQGDLMRVEKRILRHEIIHAFLFESGLDSDSYEPENWARNEEMVDWFAIQWPKISEAICQAEDELEVRK